ncbi:MAG: FtsW/RodA/SpoVE family cell cycle protein [candidate division WOR-3 bacterium]
MFISTMLEKSQKKVDFSLIAITFLLTFLGFLMSYSALFYKYNLHGISTIKFIMKELIRLGISLLAFFVGRSLDPKLYRKYIKIGILFVSSLLILTFILGTRRLGAIRWIRLGFLSFQPSELAKLILILYLADSIASHKESLKNFREFVKILLFPVIIFLLVAIQPNLSTALIIFIVTLGIIYVAGVRISFIVIPTFIGILFAFLLIFTMPGKFRHVKNRVTNFLKGNETYQVKQARIAISQGGLFGKGIGKGTQKYLYLPYAENDFMFALIAEELGVVSVIFIILCYAFLTIKGFLVSRRHIQAKFYYALIASGISLIIFTSSAIHIAVNLGLIPPTGQTLPLLSVGGSSLTLNLFALGMLEYLSEDAMKYEIF